MERALWGLGPEDVLAVQNSINLLVPICGSGGLAREVRDAEPESV